MSQLSYTNVTDGDQPLAAGFNSRFLLAINLLNSGIESDNIASSAVTTTKIANDAVTLAKMEDGTQGDVLYYGASGAPSRLTAGTSGQFLQTLGAGAKPHGQMFLSQLVALGSILWLLAQALPKLLSLLTSWLYVAWQGLEFVSHPST